MFARWGRLRTPPPDSLAPITFDTKAIQAHKLRVQGLGFRVTLVNFDRHGWPQTGRSFSYQQAPAR